MVHTSLYTADARGMGAHVIFLSLIQLGALGTSLLALPLTSLLAWGILALAAAGALAFWRRTLSHSRAISPAEDALPRARRFLWIAWVLGCVLFLVVLAALAWVTPDFSWDGNAYHIPTLALWEGRGYVHWIQADYLKALTNGYPKAAEVVAYVLVKALGDGPLNAINLLFLPLGILGIATLARSLGVSPWLARAAGLAFALIPVNVNQSHTTYVDTAYACAAISFLSSLLLAGPGEKLTGRALIPLGASLGLAIGVKSSGLGLGALGMGAWLLWQASARLGVKRLLWGCLVVGAISGSIGGYWYARNWVQTGTPLYPVGVQLGSLSIFPGVSVAEAIGEAANTPPEMEALSAPQRIWFAWTQGGERWPETLAVVPDGRLGGLGFFWLLGCLPAILAALIGMRSQGNSPWIRFLLLAGIVGGTFLITPMNWWARYTVWVYALGLPCVAWLSQKLLRWPSAGLPHWAVRAWMGLCVGVLVFEAGYCLYRLTIFTYPGSLRQNPVGVLNPKNWDHPNALLPELQGTALDVLLREGGTVAIGPRQNQSSWAYCRLVGQLSQPVGARRLIFLRDQEIDVQLQRQRPDYVFWDGTLPLPPELAQAAVRVEQGGEFWLLTLR